MEFLFLGNDHFIKESHISLHGKHRNDNDDNCHKSSCEMNWQTADQSSINKKVSLNDLIFQNLL